MSFEEPKPDDKKKPWPEWMGRAFDRIAEFDRDEDVKKLREEHRARGKESIKKKEFLDRQAAAEILRRVADFGESGNLPKDISMYELGRAIGRIASNSREENGTKDLEAGIFGGKPTSEVGIEEPRDNSQN